MLRKMRYRLAVDLGTTSIGWCVLRLNSADEPVAIIKMGVRIFSDGRNPKDGSSLAVTRRTARQARRRRDRLLKRKQRMIDALVRLGFFPEDEAERQQLVALNPYELRRKGLDEALTGGAFARALFHINQRRGFLSNRKTDKKDKESGALKRAIKELREKLDQEKCRTLGEWLAKRYENRESVRARLRGKTQKDKAYDFYADRSMVEHEFDLLWNKQREFNPALYNDAARDELKDILLYQRPLKPVQPGRCTLIPEEERAPLALPSTQRFRIYQEVNNLRILSADLKETPLTLEQRDQVVELLESKNKVSFTQIRRRLGISGASGFNLEDNKRDGLKGNATSVAMAKKNTFGSMWYRFSPELQDRIVDELLNEHSLDKLIEWLQKNTEVDELTAEEIADLSLPEGYGNLSRAALSRVVPELKKDVVVYSDAVKAAGFESHSALSHAEQTGEIMESLPYYGIPLQRHVAFEKENPTNEEEQYGKIGNPTVHIGLNQLRRVVNALIKKYGNPSEVVVEVARELKLSRERKQDVQKEQAKRQKLNTDHVVEACRVLGINPDHIDKAKRRELSQKMQLWVELNPKNVADRQCPYTGQQISIERLLSNEVEIEHIFPFSKTLDDSMNNKTVSLRNANRDKGNQTPYEAFGSDSEYDYEAILCRAALMPKAKAKRFAPDGYQRWLNEEKDFLARSLNDTAYFSRIAKEYLSLICPPNKVRAIPGRMTALLRGKFGLNPLLSGTAAKNRDDHRHHALDAAVIGVTDQGLLQRFATASASARAQQLNRLVEEMPLPWDTYRDHVERALSSIVISHKPDHGYQGAMHEETAWGLRGKGVATRRVRSDVDSPRQRETKNKKLIEINSTRNFGRHGKDEHGNANAYKGYVGGNNHCIEIVKDEMGKWSGEVVSTFDAYQLVKRYGESEALKYLNHPNKSITGKPLVMRLRKGDLAKIHVGDD